jgi:hypothetical protein
MSVDDINTNLKAVWLIMCERCTSMIDMMYIVDISDKYNMEVIYTISAC